MGGGAVRSVGASAFQQLLQTAQIVLRILGDTLDKVDSYRKYQCHEVGDMAGETVTRAYLSEALYEAVGLSRKECAELVDTVLREISDTLTKGEAVKISSFGSFWVRQKGERIGRNPRTGEEAPILARCVINFRASHVLKNLINSAHTESG